MLQDPDRAYTASADLRPFGGRDDRVLFGVPGNIISPAQFAGAIPAGQNGVGLTPADILKGQTVLFNNHGARSLLPRETLNSAFLSATQSVGERLELYADVLASRRTTLYTNPGAAIAASVPATNYYRQLNGFGGTAPLVIDYDLSKDVGELAVDGKSQMITGDFGGRLQLTGSWELDAFLEGGASREGNHQPYQDFGVAGNAFSVALASSDPAKAFNPFGDGGDNSAAVISSFVVPYHVQSRSRYASANLNLDGDLFQLPGGPVKLAAGAELRTEQFRYFSEVDYNNRPPGINNRRGNRQISAVFGELHVPIVGEANALPWVRSLDVSLSARYDHYSDFGSATNPKVGVTYEPVRGVLFHGSYGTSFKAPRLNDLITPITVQYYAASKTFGGPDPNGDGVTEALLVSGGNPSLTAEKGKAWTAGVTFEPAALPGFRADLTYFRLDFRDRIASLPSILLPLQNPAPYLGSVYFLNPTQAQVDAYVAKAAQILNTLPAGINAPMEVIIVSQVANVSVVDLDGIDVHAEQAFETSLGRFTASAAFTRYMKYESQFSPTSPATTTVGIVGAPVALKGRLGLAWRRDGWSASAFANYMDHAWNTTITPAVRVKSQTTVDAQVSYRFPETGPVWSRGVVATLAAANLFDRDPPFADVAGYGFDAKNYSPIGRLVSFTLEKRW
jgi:iron complex outermembrane receptor protein